MTDKLRAAMQAAIRDLEFFQPDACKATIDALRAALAEQPVKESLTTHPSIIDSIADHLIDDHVALMNENKRMRDAAPPRREWQGLTDEEIDKLFGKANTAMYLAERLRKRDLEIYSFGARDAEAALREKNRD